MILISLHCCAIDLDLSLSLSLRLGKIMSSSPLRIFTSTWNVAAFPSFKAAQQPAFADMLVHSHGINDLPDVYAISLQEIVPLNAVNILVSAGETQVALESWSTCILKVLNENAQGVTFALVDHIAVVGTALLVFVRKAFLIDRTIRMGTVMSSSLNLGQFYTGNKAAVAIRARIGNQTVCFVSVHFAAHRGQASAQTRTEHMTYTVQQLAFYGCMEMSSMKTNSSHDNNDGKESMESMDRALLSESESEVVRQVEVCSLAVGDHDLCVLLGDLNARMKENIDQSRVWNVVNEWGGIAAGENVNHEKASQEMLPWDELWSEPMASTLRNLRFQEGPVTFAPTYKLTPGESKYHIPSPDKPKKIFNHCPSWCDRVLFSTRIPCKQIKYFSAPVFYSDHLPVFAVFDLGQVANVETGETNVLDARENEARQKSLNFVRQRSASYGMCGSGSEDCHVM